MNESELLRARGRVAAAVAVTLMLFVSYAMFASVPSSAAGAPPGAAAFSRVVPEGWAFFTRSPREPRQTMWQRAAGGEWAEAKIGSNSSPNNVFGAARWVRAQDVELGQLYQKAVSQSDEWTACPSGDTALCLETAPKHRPVHNEVVSKTLCGTVGIGEQEPLPWAWAKTYHPASMPLKVLKLDVLC